MAVNGQNMAKLDTGEIVTINNLVPDRTSRKTDSSSYINNPTMLYFPYTGYTRVWLAP